jgi:hypothetical protein
VAREVLRASRRLTLQAPLLGERNPQGVGEILPHSAIRTHLVELTPCSPGKSHLSEPNLLIAMGIRMRSVYRWTLAENSLARLAKIAGDAKMAARRKVRIEQSVAAMRRHMWDEASGTFLSVRRDSLEKVPVATIGCWMSLMAGVPTDAMARRMAEALRTEHWTTPLPALESRTRGIHPVLRFGMRGPCPHAAGFPGLPTEIDRRLSIPCQSLVPRRSGVGTVPHPRFFEQQGQHDGDSMVKPMNVASHPTYQRRLLYSMCFFVPLGIIGIATMLSRSRSSEPLDLSDPVNLAILLGILLGIGWLFLSRYFVRCPTCSRRCRQVKSADDNLVQCKKCGQTFSLGPVSP